MDWIEFPSLSRGQLLTIKKTIDGSFKDFTRAYGDYIDSFFNPLQDFLIFLENLMINSPWPLVLLAFALVVYLLSRRISITIGTVGALVFIGVFYTLCTGLAIPLIGIPSLQAWTASTKSVRRSACFLCS